VSNDVAPFLGLPARTQWANLALLCSAFALAFLFLYGGASWLSGFVPWRVAIAFDFESRLPFIAGAAAIYLSMLLLVGIAPFVLRDLQQILPLFLALLGATSVASACFVLLPVVDLPAPRPPPGASGVLFRCADWLNLERNYLPSLHVAMATIAALAYAPHAKLPIRGLLTLWVVAIAASTMVTKQHYWLDVLTGLALGYVAWHMADGAVRRKPSIIAAFDAELLCLRNFTLFARRHLRYLRIGVLLLLLSVRSFRRRRLARVGFAFLQAIDDLLDGDRPSQREPLVVVDELQASLRSGQFADDDLSRLGRVFRAEILHRGGDGALAQALALIAVMQRDRERVLRQELLDADALRAIHRQTFVNSLDLMLLAADAELRAADVPELVDALGWCSTVRDLEEDLARGLINIPSEVVEAARQIDAATDPATLLGAASVQRWLAAELERARALLASTEQRLQTLADRSGASLLRTFARSIHRYTQR
jgi:membrane-associated phospholipid phosphatase